MASTHYLDSKAKFDGFIESGTAVRFRRKNDKGHDDKHTVAMSDLFKAGSDRETRRRLRELGINQRVIGTTLRMAHEAKLTPLH